MKAKDQVLKLNTPENKRVIRDFFRHSGKEVELSKIKYKDSEYRLYINGKRFLYWDRHCHYPNVKDHCIANYLFLRTVEDVIEHQKD